MTNPTRTDEAMRSPHPLLSRFTITDAPADMRAAASTFERRHDVRFATLTRFTSAGLARLHAPSRETGPALPPVVALPPADGDAVARAMTTLTRVANAEAKSLASRHAYLAALHTLFGALPTQPHALARRGDTLCVAPEREGRQLASALGCLPPGRSLTPHAKRIPLDGGIVVGLSALLVPTGPSECVLVDGVIASGTTLIATIEAVRAHVSRFHVFCAHSTRAGLWALHRYAQSAGIRLRVSVAAVSGELDSHYYAVDPADGRTLVLGDVGDTIAGLDEARPGSLQAGGAR